MNKEAERLVDVAKHMVLHQGNIGTVICNGSPNLYFLFKSKYKFALQQSKDEAKGWLFYCDEDIDITELAEFEKRNGISDNAYCAIQVFQDIAPVAYNDFLELCKIVDGKRPSQSKVIVHKAKSKFDLDMDDILGSSE
jgi:hypothetical protein